ncbi:MAG: hypothetical protein EOP09_06355, partial [Proteobacteria bacterium]
MALVLAVTGLTSCEEQYAFEGNKTSQNQKDSKNTYSEGGLLPPPNSDICLLNPDADACTRDSEVSTPGVVTVLFTVSQIPQGAASLILANAVKYASPSDNPKILFLKDTNTNGEDEGDSAYIKNTLLAGYDVEYKEIKAGGLGLEETLGKDLVIVSNPGHPLSSPKTLATLGAFAGGVILVGDDLAHGST